MATVGVWNVQMGVMDTHVGAYDRACNGVRASNEPLAVAVWVSYPGQHGQMVDGVCCQVTVDDKF